MFCSSCGVELSESPRPNYCQNCGTRLEGIIAKCGQSEEKEYKVIPDHIGQGLVAAFGDDLDSCSRALFFLSERIAAESAKPFIMSLENVLSNAMLFKKVAERLVEDTKTVEKDQQFRQEMYGIWNDELKGLVNKHPDGGSELALAIQKQLTTGQYDVATYCFLRAVSLFPEVVGMIATVMERMGRQIAVIEGLSLVPYVMVMPVVTVALATAFLAWEVIENIKRWWNGEISGKRCVKNIIDHGVGVAAGFVGGCTGQMVGGAIGSVFGPIGTVCGMFVGGVVGGILASITAEKLCDLLTRHFFGLPKSEALENAYSFLDISPNTSNGAVNSRYRHLALKYHPDKGGDPEMWTRLQYSLAFIREGREES